MKKSKLTAGILMLSMMAALMTGCNDSSSGDNGNISQSESRNKETETSEVVVETKKLGLTIDVGTTYQTIESFGASGAWWSQDVGGWINTDEAGVESREQIATWLFDQENGIGLTAYRYNIGAGSADSGNSYAGITDSWRRAESFETEPGVYDWTKDENAVWFMNRASEYGVEEIVLFCNSPLERLTKNGKAYGDATTDGSPTSNLSADNYREFAEYVLDVAEHFIELGYPVKYVSPINEPQWDWTGGQEGCHYEPEEVVAFLNVFLDVMDERNIEGLELSAPELGEWGNTSYDYYEAIFSDQRLLERLTSLDVHSYWSDTTAKKQFVNWLDIKGYELSSLKMSEWCEMTNGKDFSMDSAINLAKEIHADLTTLNVTSWQYWIAVSCYNYRDGLIYVNTASKTGSPTKRLWAMGNYSRFIRPGYVRVDCQADATEMRASAYTGIDSDGNENLVIVIINPTDSTYEFDTSALNGWSFGEAYITDKDRSLEKYADIDVNTEVIELSPMSVVTISMTK